MCCCPSAVCSRTCAVISCSRKTLEFIICVLFLEEVIRPHTARGLLQTLLLYSDAFKVAGELRIHCWKTVRVSLRVKLNYLIITCKRFHYSTCRGIIRTLTTLMLAETWMFSYLLIHICVWSKSAIPKSRGNFGVADAQVFSWWDAAFFSRRKPPPPTPPTQHMSWFKSLHVIVWAAFSDSFAFGVILHQQPWLTGLLN